MDKSKRELLDLLARLYILLAAIDLEFQDAEELAIREQLNEWAPDFNQEKLNEIISSAIIAFKSSDQLQIFNESSEILKEYFDENNKRSVLKDLIAIAVSDGIVHDNERKMINSLAEDWGMADDLDIDKYVREEMIDSAPDTGDFLRKAGSIFHDVLTLLIYIGNESKNDIGDPEWESIYSNIVQYNLVIGNKSFNIAKYKQEEISDVVNVVLERMWGNEEHPRDPSISYQQSVKNIYTYYENGTLDQVNIYTIIRLMFEVSIADRFITNSQKNILEEIIKTFIQVIPGLKNINDLIRIQLEKQNPDKSIVPDSKPRTGGGIKIAFETKKIENELDDQQPEIIAEVHKEGGNYRAKIKDTGKDITEMIDNPAKLKSAYERSGLIRGKRNKAGSYDWRVVRKNTD